MSDQNENTEKVDIASEFSRLGKNLQEVMQAAVESEEWKKIRSEVQQGINDLGDTLGNFIRDFGESPTGQKVKSGLNDLQTQVRQAEIEGRVREEVLSALRQANAGLEKAAGKMRETPETEPADQASSGEPPAPPADA